MKLTFKQALVLLHYLQLDIPDSVMELAEIPEDFYFPSAKVIAKYPDRRKDGLKIIEYLRAVADALEEGIKEAHKCSSCIPDIHDPAFYEE